ncbi:MAG TPA: HlyD family efflux transporter periplasmic adaptor subunit [Acidobacteriota bacterium]|jgi:multidrug efflux pump subunit AcrA (membrane-fusion protein)
MKKWIFLSSLSVILIVGGVWAYTTRQFPSWSDFFALAQNQPVIYTLKKMPFTIEIPAFGELQTAKSTPISVPQVRTGGLKVFAIVKNGTMVKKGDVLVEFDASELLMQADKTKNSLESALKQLEVTVLRGNSDTGQVSADREIASMELDKAKTQAPKDQEIFTRNQIIEGELDVNLSTTKVTELGGKVDTKKKINDTSQRILVIERKQHESKRDMLQQSLGSLKILSPHDGLVLHQKEGWWMEQGTSVGDTRWPGMVILTIPDITSMKARVYVLESDAGNLKVGQSGRIVVDSHPGMRFDVTVERIETLARPVEKDSPVKYFEVLLNVPAKGSEILRPGKLVRAKIQVAHIPEALVVPRSALVEENRKFSVWVQRADAPERREVEIGTGDSARIVLQSGVREGDAVLLNPPRVDQGSKEKAGSAAPSVSNSRPGAQ